VKTQDALSYRSVNVPISRIFTIDPNGEVKLELLSGYKSSYLHLNDLVDQIFPPINKKLVEEYNDWNFWKAPLPDFDLPELPLPEAKIPPPKTPPLSSSPPADPSMSDIRLAPSKSMPTLSTSPTSTGSRSRRLFFASSFDLSKDKADPALPKFGKETASPVQSDDESTPTTRDQAPGVVAQRADGGDASLKPASLLGEEVVGAVGKDTRSLPPPAMEEDGSEYEGDGEEMEDDEEVGSCEDDTDDDDELLDIDSVPY